jgi:hypothetical protein
MRASVVLPLPDSPTMASVSPAASSRLTSSTAATRAAAPLLGRDMPIVNAPVGAENVFRNLRASSSGACIKDLPFAGQTSACGFWALEIRKPTG